MQKMQRCLILLQNTKALQMNIKALRAFRTTLSEGSLTAASEIMHLSQPAISRLISGLEAELKLTLFDRSGRALTPTPEGMSFYREAGRILDNLDEVPRIAAEIRAGRSESLRIVTMPRIAQAVTIPAIARFMKEHPEVNVSLDVRSRRDAGNWLAGRAYDIGVGALPVQHPGIRTQALIRVRGQAVLPSGHPLSNRTEVTAEDLIDEPVIRLMHGLLLREQLDDIFSSAGVSPKQSVEVASSQTACGLVAAGAGITIADELSAAEIRPGLIELVPLSPERWMTFGTLDPIAQKSFKALEDFKAILSEHTATLAENSPTLAVA